VGKLALTALVLAGGKSTRLGQDKAFTPVGGRPMVERVLEVVRQVCDEILILGGDGGKTGIVVRRPISRVTYCLGQRGGLTKITAAGTQFAFAFKAHKSSVDGQIGDIREGRLEALGA